MNKNALQEPKKINLIKNTQNAKTVEALTHTHTRYVYKIKENLKKFLFAMQQIDRNNSLILMGLKPLDTS